MPRLFPVSPLVGLVCAGVALAACRTEERDVVSVAPRPAGIEGRWADTTGIAISSLTGGKFTTTDTKTGAVLANGSYRTLGPGQVAIEYTRRGKGERIAVNCNQTAADRLSCVNSGGTRFELTRRV